MMNDELFDSAQPGTTVTGTTVAGLRPDILPNISSRVRINIRLSHIEGGAKRE